MLQRAGRGAMERVMVMEGRWWSSAGMAGET